MPDSIEMCQMISQKHSHSTSLTMMIQTSNPPHPPLSPTTPTPPYPHKGIGVWRDAYTRATRMRTLSLTEYFFLFSAQ